MPQNLIENLDWNLFNTLNIQVKSQSKEPKGVKVKLLFQLLHMTCVIFSFVYNL